MKSKQEQIVAFILAALFRLQGLGVKQAFDEAEAFIKEGKRRDIDLEKMK